MHLVGFIIRIFHDARSPECQILFYKIEAVIQVAEPSFLGGPSPELCRSPQLQWSSVAERYHTMKNLGLPSYFSQLLLEPLPILFLSTEFSFLVAPAPTGTCFTTNVVFFFTLYASFSKMVCDWTIWLPYFGFNNVKSVKIARLF